MRSLLNPRDRKALAERVGALTPDRTPRWGRMDVSTMLAHLCESARMSLGDLPVKSKNKRAFQVFPLKHLFLYVVPFPKGLPTAPELLAGPAGPIETQRARLLELWARYGAGSKDDGGPSHPIFGPLSRHEWGVLGHKHADHHLRQFGV